MPNRKPIRFLILVAVMVVTFAPNLFSKDQEGSKPDDASAGGGGPPPAAVRIAAVEMATLSDRWEGYGELVEVRRSQVAAEVEGRVMSMEVEEGAAVVGGQTALVEIDKVWSSLNVQAAQATLSQTQADVAEATALLDQATRDRQQLADLLARGTAKQKEFDDAQAREKAEAARLEAARAQVAAAQAQLSRSQEQLARVRVVAPFDGVVVKKHVEVGQWVSPGTTVVDLISRGPIDAVIDVPERVVYRLKVGDPITVHIDSLNEDITGPIRAVVPEGSAARTFPVKVRLEDRNGQLKPKMSVRALLPIGSESQYLVVPTDAIMRGELGAMVWLNLNGMAMPVRVDVLFNDGGRVAVKQVGEGPPLSPGMSVVIEGAERLFPTRPLIIIPDGEQPQGAAAMAQ